MEAKFVQTSDDLVALWHHYFHRTLGRGRRLVGTAVSTIPVMVVAGMVVAMFAEPPSAVLRPLTRSPLTAVAASAFLGSLLLFAALVPIYFAWAHSRSGVRWRVWRLLRQGKVDRLFLGPKKVSLDESGVRIGGDGFETSLSWPLIVKIAVEPDHLLLFQDYPTKQASGFIVPRWAFASEFDFAEFCQLAQDYWQAARSKAPAQ